MGNSAGPEAGIVVRRMLHVQTIRSDLITDNETQVAVVLVILATLAFIAYLLLRYIRKSHPNPKYVPTEALKRRWQAWHPRGMRLSKEGYGARLQESSSVPTLHLRSDNRNSRASMLNLADVERMGAEGEDTTNTSTADVDRRVSVRSVVTLPAYSRSVRETERVLGREGERDGVDVVVEQPETADEEEARRDEEMEALYQIRAQRRREVDEREQRRRDRSEARDRGDVDALRRMRQESALRAEERDTTGATAMIRDFRARSRERRVSSVSYADIGVARHDGSRVRANSNESDRPLLDFPANFSRHSLRPWATRSSMSISGDDETRPPPFGRAGTDFEVVTAQQTHSRATSSHSAITSHSRSPSSSRLRLHSIDTGVDLGEAHVPLSDPPAYTNGDFEEAPPYRSPDQHRAPTRPDEDNRPQSSADTPLLPEIHRLPSIRVAEATPINPGGSIEWPSSAR